MIELNTDVFCNKYLSGNNIEILGSAESKIEIEITQSNPDSFICTLKKNNEGKKEYRLVSTDVFTVTHDFNVKYNLNTFDGFFPLRIDYKGQEYYLKETKNGKLILTK